MTLAAGARLYRAAIAGSSMIPFTNFFSQGFAMEFAYSSSSRPELCRRPLWFAGENRRDRLLPVWRGGDLKRELGLVAVNFDASLNLDDVVAADVFCGGLKLIPHDGFDGAAAVAELETEIRICLRGYCEFLFRERERKR